jgi:hypothetical protein
VHRTDVCQAICAEQYGFVWRPIAPQVAFTFSGCLQRQAKVTRTCVVESSTETDLIDLDNSTTKKSLDISITMSQVETHQPRRQWEEALLDVRDAILYCTSVSLAITTSY